MTNEKGRSYKFSRMQSKSCDTSAICHDDQFLTNPSARIPIGIDVRTSRFVQKRVPRIDVRDESNTVIDPVQVDASEETPRPIPFVKRMVSSRGLLLIALVVLGAWLMLRLVDAI